MKDERQKAGMKRMAKRVSVGLDMGIMLLT
jgi:hypothetical protein